MQYYLEYKIQLLYFDYNDDPDHVGDWDTTSSEIEGTSDDGLEGGDDIDDELSVLREKLRGGAEAVALPAAELSSNEIDAGRTDLEVEAVDIAEVDADLEELKRSIEKL